MGYAWVYSLFHFGNGAFKITNGKLIMTLTFTPSLKITKLPAECLL